MRKAGFQLIYFLLSNIFPEFSLSSMKCIAWTIFVIYFMIPSKIYKFYPFPVKKIDNYVIY